MLHSLDVKLVLLYSFVHVDDLLVHIQPLQVLVDKIFSLDFQALSRGSLVSSFRALALANQILLLLGDHVEVSVERDQHDAETLEYVEGGHVVF